MRQHIRKGTAYGGDGVLDGSSSHVQDCWAYDASAELLLRVQEVAHLDANVNLKL